MDYYLEDRSRLKGQPKRTIADYVESCGIPVPRRFETLAEARKSGLPILVRSEHPLEYDGIAGLLDSRSLRDYNNIKDEDCLRTEMLSPNGTRDNKGLFLLREYSQLLGLSPEDNIRLYGFSLWHELAGTNVTVVADSSIPRRYHILQNSDTSESYTVIEDLEPVYAAGFAPMDKMYSIISLYENIRTLDHFEPANCPQMEMQVTGDQIYFLQYRRGRKFSQVDWCLEPYIPTEQYQALFVRGHTSKDGWIGQATVSYKAYQKQDRSFFLPESEFGAFSSMRLFYAHSAIMYRRRSVQFIDMPSFGGLDSKMINFAGRHSQLSELHNPAVSLIYDSKINRDFGDAKSINVWIISDGRRAFFKRVD